MLPASLPLFWAKQWEDTKRGEEKQQSFIALLELQLLRLERQVTLHQHLRCHVGPHRHGHYWCSWS